MANSFLKPYLTQDLIRRTRAANLFWVLVAFVLGMLALGVSTFLQNSWKVPLMAAVVSAFLISALLLLRTGRYQAAANMALGVLILAAGAGVLITRSGSAEDDVVRTMALFSLTLTMTTFFGYSRWQSIVMGLGGIATIGLLQVMPPDATQLAKTLTELNKNGDPVSITILFLLTAMLSVLNLIQQTKMLDTSKRSQDISDEGFREISSSFERTQDGKKISHEMDVAATNLSQTVESIDTELHVLNRQADTLQDQARASAATSEDLDQIQILLQSRMEAQISAIQLTSAALEQITANVQSITAMARSKTESLRALGTQAEQGELRMKQLSSSFSNMQKTAGDVLQVVAVIEDIASRTNLLAMNASIEAAHAGNSGRGFAVVAAEIRKLAEETGNNSKAIRQTLDKNREHVEVAASASQSSVQLIQSMVQAFRDIQTLLSEQLEGMEELAIGNSHILQTVVVMRDGTQEVRESAIRVHEAVQGNRSNVGQIEKSTGVLREGVQTLREVAAVIAESVGQLQAIGNSNLQHVNTLSENLETIQSSLEAKRKSLQ